MLLDEKVNVSKNLRYSFEFFLYIFIPVLVHPSRNSQNQILLVGEINEKKKNIYF